MALENIQVFDILLGGIGLFILKKIIDTSSKKKQLPLPPGPKRKPLIGNLLDLPQGELDWLHWLKHKDLYGEHDYFYRMVIRT